MKKTITLLSTLSALALFSSCTPQPTNTNTATAGSHPTAYPTDKKNLVISPFAPHNILDVKGMSPGNLAKDPTTAAIDPNTKKVISGSAKIFRIPSPAPKPPTQ